VSLDIFKLAHYVDEKLKFKETSLEERRGEFEKKEKRLEKLWHKRLSIQISSLPEYESVFRTVKRTFRQAGLLDDKVKN